MHRKKLIPWLLVLATACSGPMLLAQVMVSDDSDGPFTILAQMVAVTSPNGGENWNAGEIHYITWSADASIAGVSIDYSTDSGGTWATVAINIANSGAYNWTVPATISTACLVRVSAFGNAGNNDFSDRVFSISNSGTETVTAPDVPSGAASGSLGISYTFGSGGANSNLGDPLQYKFDWGDGTDSGWLEVGTGSAAHVWTIAGTYQVRAMARCSIHTAVESPWSAALSVNMADGIPGVLWNTFLGASSNDTGRLICEDANGNAFIVGISASTWGSPMRAYSGQIDVFVAKLDASGNLLWNTFLGSGSMDYGNGIAIDSSGNIFITGYSTYSWGSPLNPFFGYPSSDGDKDAFVAKLNANGVLQWNTFMGGSGNDSGLGICLDVNGNIFVSGTSSDWGSPLNPYDGGDSDAFVAKLNTNGIFQWHTFLGGHNSVNTNNDSVQRIALDDNGNIYVTGSSTATWGNPINPFSGSVMNNYADALLAKLSPSGAMEWLTFMGGTSDDHGYGIGVDNSGNIYVTGMSNSTWGTPLNPYGGGGNDAFVAKFNANGGREWNTFIGGASNDNGYCIALEKSGYVLVAGSCSATWGNPLNPHNGDGDAFVARLAPNGSLRWNTFLGGPHDDGGYGVALDNNGCILATGYSTSNWGTPLRPFSGSGDGFVAKLCIYSDTLAVITPNGGEDWAADSIHCITWSLLSQINSINIDYSTNNGGTWIPVATNIVNNGLYDWTVPATPSLNCLVRVSDSANAATYDISDGLFFISASSIENVTAPAQPSGPDTCLINGSYGFSTSGAVSSLGHALQYRFDWGDGTDSGWLVPGTTSAVHSWSSSGTYHIRAMARCSVHTGVESAWSTAHDITVPAVDSPLLLWNTFMGGNQNDSGESVTTDDTGNIYVIGESYASWGTPLNPHSGGYCDVFVAKLNPNGVLLWHTFLGGSYFDYGMDIAVDDSGNIYIVGYSSASWGSPIVPYAGGGYDGFVAKLNSDGVQQWNTFMGCTSYDSAMSIALDSSGNIYATGASMASWGTPFNPFSGGIDSFLAKFHNNGARQWNTFFRGTSLIFGKNGITVDDSGNVFVAGYSGSSWGTPLNPFSGEGIDLLVVKFNDNGAMQWHTFLGSRDSLDYGEKIALDVNGNIYVAGKSNASWGSPLNPYGGGPNDAIVIKLNVSGIYQWHTFMGGSDEDSASGIALSQNGDSYVSGTSYLTWDNPLNSFAGYVDGFIAKLNSDGVRQYHTFVGSSKYDQTCKIMLDSIGNIVVTGISDNIWGTPINPHSGNLDAFVVKFGKNVDNFTVTSPNGGESWTAGESHDIIWGSTGTIASVDIDFSIDNGLNWVSIASSTENDGLFNWTVSSTPSTTCLVRVSDTDGDPSDASDSTFTIQPGAIAPVISGAILIGSSPLSGVVINGLPGNPATDGSGFYTSSVDYDWSGTVTPTLAGYVFTPASRAYSNITSDQTGQDYAAALASLLELTCPNGWEHWTLGSSKAITWNAVNYTGTVRLVLFKSGTRFGNIAANIPATDGSYAWTVGLTYDSGMAPEGTDYRLYLRSTDNTIVDPSDYRLALIDPAQLEVTSPNGGESWELGTTQDITWNANGYAGTVRLILFQKAAKIGQIVADLPADQGSYAWTVGVHQAGVAAAGNLYSIRLLAGDGSQEDFSDGPLTLVDGDALIVDHQHTTLNTIPSHWLDQASRRKLLVLSARGQDGIALGLRLLGDRDARLATSNNSISLGLVLTEGSWLPQGANLDLREWQWALEKAILDSQATVVIIRPDEEALLAGRLNAESYLSVLNELANRLPQAKLVCSTVALDEANDTLVKFNRQVRESVLQNKGMLFDAADIESWRNGEQKLMNEIPLRHPGYRLQGTPGEENPVRQGAVAWWLLARLAGWPGPLPPAGEK